uniref:Uncharacterized protein n=1 Tax=Coccidioides posadasii RMSCC 3488 TaxID=454284 RepID=A0A0J6F0L8_COCPO|nr:hypothetical protein CPAG_02760 [Coccidioides posadasii RMSCC 3488]
MLPADEPADISRHAGGVSNDPGDDERVSTEKEGEEIVCCADVEEQTHADQKTMGAETTRGHGDCCQSVGSIPACYTDGLFSTPIPMAGDDAEERKASSFKKGPIRTALS